MIYRRRVRLERHSERIGEYTALLTREEAIAEILKHYPLYIPWDIDAMFVKGKKLHYVLPCQINEVIVTLTWSAMRDYKKEWDSK